MGTLLQHELHLHVARLQGRVTLLQKYGGSSGHDHHEMHTPMREHRRRNLKNAKSMNEAKYVRFAVKHYVDASRPFNTYLKLSIGQSRSQAAVSWCQICSQFRVQRGSEIRDRRSDYAAPKITPHLWHEAPRYHDARICTGDTRDKGAQRRIVPNRALRRPGTTATKRPL